MAAVKAWKFGDPNCPAFPDDFEIVKKAVLQVTDIKSNHNKYYAIELHKAGPAGAVCFRVFTHYGRTDDLETNPDAGQKECRFFDSVAEAEAAYLSIYREKTSPRKGYKEVALASNKIGSQKARGSSSGELDDKTLQKLARARNGDGAAAQPPASSLHPGVQALVRYLYDEATTALTSTVNATITAHGIETPLGVLTLGQIEKGEDILTRMYELFQRKPRNLADQLRQLSGDFFSAVPHRIGRSRQAVEEAVIDSLAKFQQKQETLQLMKDMLQVNGEGGSVLFDARVDQEYQALGCEIGWLEPGSPRYRELADHVVRSQVKSKSVRVKNVYAVKRPPEWEAFAERVGNQRMLFHGSRVSNWVGILTRGILLPKIVVSMGVNRTDEGWLGHGLYFGDAACTSAFYTTPGRKGTRFMTVARVALGKVKDYTKITYGLTKPPEGYDSCHGVRRGIFRMSDFDDDEYVIYDTRQQRLEYLVEFTA
jgi:poly [ADP-ribose] polymerase 2/3/4